MDLTGHALRVSIFVGQDDMWQHTPLYHEIVRRAHGAGLAGATVLHGTEGFGAASFVHTDRLLSMAEGLPTVVIIIDAEDRVRAFLPQLDEIIAEGTVLVDEVEVLRTGGKPQA
jgi:uncharacterized protein